MRCVGGDMVEESLWLLGAGGASTLAATASVAPTGASRAFPDGGFYVMRDGWERSTTWALVDGGPHGSLNCGHAHADALALEVAAGGRLVLCDSGTFSYTGAERDAFRATSSHNTATVDGTSSSLTAGQFHWRSIARTTVHEWRTSPTADVWRGSHDGYERLADPAVHERTVLFLHQRYLVVLDTIAALGAHEWTLHWHVAPDLAVRRAGAAAVQVTDPARADADVLELVALGGRSLDLATTWRSGAYGARREAPSISCASSGTGRQTVVTLLLPGTVHARALGAAQGGMQGADVVGARLRDQVVHRGSSATISLADVTTDAECAVVTAGADGVREWLYLLGASFVEGGGLDRRQVTAGGVFTARHEHGRWVARPIHDRSPE
jgi:hypothetical protein